MAFLPETSEPSSFWALTHFAAFTRPLRSSPSVRVNCTVGEVPLQIFATTWIWEWLSDHRASRPHGSKA